MDSHHGRHVEGVVGVLQATALGAAGGRCGHGQRDAAQLEGERQEVAAQTGSSGTHRK